MSRTTRYRMLLCAALTAVTMLLVPAGIAEATAIGSVYIAPFKIGVKVEGNSFKVPVITGTFTHAIKGKHRLVQNDGAVYEISPTIPGLIGGRACNWRIDFEYYNADDNKMYRSERGPTSYGCPLNAKREISPGVLQHYGRACARLYINGERRASQCHKIT